MVAASQSGKSWRTSNGSTCNIATTPSNPATITAMRPWRKSTPMTGRIFGRSPMAGAITGLRTGGRNPARAVALAVAVLNGVSQSRFPMACRLWLPSTLASCPKRCGRGPGISSKPCKRRRFRWRHDHDGARNGDRTEDRYPAAAEHGLDRNSEPMGHGHRAARHPQIADGRGVPSPAESARGRRRLPSSTKELANARSRPKLRNCGLRRWKPRQRNSFATTRMHRPMAFSNHLKARPGKSQQPTVRRYMSNDPTAAALGQLLIENPNGVLVYRDELVSLFQGARP